METMSTGDNGGDNSNSTQPGELTAPQKTLVKAWWKKVFATAKADYKLSTTADRTVFGSPLLHSIQYAHTTISYQDEITKSPCMAVIPTIIAKCGAHLKEEGLEIEGIFRLSGNSKRIGQLQALFDTSDTQYGVYLNWDDYSIHDVANVMRRFLNHLPEPVIPLNHYQLFKSTMATEFVSTDVKTQAFQNLIDQIPLVHQFLLLYLLDLLSLFTLTSHLTRMDISCLASLFAPGILSHPDDALNPSGYKESQLVLEYLIKHEDQFRMPSSRIPFVESECPLRSPLRPSMVQRSQSTPTSLLYTGKGTTNNYIHPLHSTTTTTAAAAAATPSSSPLSFLESKSTNQVNLLGQSLMFPTTSASASSSTTSLSSIQRNKTLPAKNSTPGILSSSSSSSSTSTSTSTFSLSLPSTNSDPRPTWQERSTNATTFRRQPQPQQQPNQNSPVRRWKSIRTVLTLERDGNIKTPISTQ